MTFKTFEAVASGDTLELRMYGPIGANMFGDGVSAESVSRAIESNPHCKNILVRISSPGGNAYDGMAIRAMLAAHPADKVCEVEGLAASAGSIIAMGCGKIRMHTGSAMMVHEASARMPDKGCNADDLRKMLAGIETLNDGMASVYAERTGMSKAKCRDMMAAETWLTPADAKKKGFCDEVVPGTAKMAASFDLSPYGYRNVPQEFAAVQPEPLLTPDEVSAIRELLSTKAGDDDEPSEGDEPASDAPDEDADADESDDSDDDSEPAIEQPVPQQGAEVTTAEASHVGRTRSNSMTIQLIAQAIGLQADADETAVFAAVSRIQSMVAELRSVTGVQDSDGILGAVRGLSEAAKQVPVLSAKIEEQSKSLEAQERAALFAADANDPKGRKLVPAVIEFWSARPVSELKAFLAVAPHVVSVAASGQPAVTSTVGSASASAGEAVKFNGKAWEEMSPADRHNLFVDAPETYAALQQSYVERGKPRAQSQQQRASA